MLQMYSVIDCLCSLQSVKLCLRIITHVFLLNNVYCIKSLLYTLLLYIFAYKSNPVLMPHQGEILQAAIRESGISITRIVEELGVTRPTIYRKFKDDTIDPSFVKRVGEIIGHDFSQDFTLAQQGSLPFVSPVSKLGVTHGVTSSVTPMQTLDLNSSQQLLALQTKYIALLEAYNDLLLKVYGPK